MIDNQFYATNHKNTQIAKMIAHVEKNIKHIFSQLLGPAQIYFLLIRYLKFINKECHDKQ